MYIYMTNYSEEFYKYLKHNYFFLSKIKNINTTRDKDLYIYNSIKRIYNDYVYVYNCPFTRLRLKYKFMIYYNKINMDFIIYITNHRYYTNSRYLIEKYDDSDIISDIDTKYHNIRLFDVRKECYRYFDSIKDKPIEFNKEIIDMSISLMETTCKKYIERDTKIIKRILDRFLLNDDCFDIIFSFML